MLSLAVHKKKNPRRHTQIRTRQQTSTPIESVELPFADINVKRAVLSTLP